MADDFTQRSQYGLNDLPMEPPDDPNTLFSPNGFTSIGMQRAGGSQLVPARFGFRARLGQAPQDQFPAQGGLAPGWPVPEIPVPEWWKTLGPALQILPKIITGSGGGGGPDDDDDVCYRRWNAEDAKCATRRKRFRPGCRERASERRSKCIQNGRRPSPWEPPEWSIADEW